MVRFFQSAYISRYIVIFLVMMLLWFPGFIIYSGMTGPETFSLEAEFSSVPAIRAILYIIAIILTVVPAMLFNQLAGDFGISGRISTVTAFVYALLASAITFFTIPQMFIVVNLLLVLLLRILFSIPTAKNQPVLLFNAGFITGLTAFIAPVLSLLLLLVWISLLVHRSGHWRNFAASIIGCAAPWIFIWTWYFWNDSSYQFRQMAEHTIFNMKTWGFDFPTGTDPVLLGFFLSVAMLVSLGSIFSLRERNINLRHNLTIMINFLFLSFICLVLSADKSYAMVTVIPSALAISHFADHARPRRIHNIILLVFMILALINQYGHLIFGITIN